MARTKRSLYESDSDRDQRPRKQIATAAACKSASWEPARYHYPSDSEDETTTPAHPPTAVPQHRDPQEEIKTLRNHIDELHKFIEDAGVLLKAPASIRQYLDARPNAAAVFAAAIRDRMSKATKALGYDDDDSPPRCMDGDDYSRAVAPFVKDIRTLSRYPQADSLDLALDLIMELGTESIGDLDIKGGSGYGERPSDIQADDLFCYLARKKRRQDPSWNFYPILHDFVDSNKCFAGYGIDTYFVNSIDLMQDWKKATAAVDLT
ncbi:hypothetical protein LTR27_009235 [Elasticomyces elasticus]|nr:hypothetical protein LTR27_009235 [Elasticomyces elasticus]